MLSAFGFYIWTKQITTKKIIRIQPTNRNSDLLRMKKYLSRRESKGMETVLTKKITNTR